MDGHRPRATEMLRIERRDHLVDRLIGGKNAMIARHLAQHHIDGFNGIGGVNHLTDVLRKGKERDDAREVGPATIC
jgi:hypothetical protein